MPLVCRETVAELFVALSYPKFKLDDARLHAAVAAYLPFCETVALPVPLPVLQVRCRDPRDEKFIHLARAGRADALVTGDADLLVLQGKAPVRLVTALELKAMLAPDESGFSDG